MSILSLLDKERIRVLCQLDIHNNIKESKILTVEVKILKIKLFQ